MNKFKERLRESRKQEGITQKVLAKNIGRTEDCIHDWENGRSEPSIDDIIAIAQFLRVSTDFLLGNDDPDDLFAETPTVLASGGFIFHSSLLFAKCS